MSETFNIKQKFGQISSRVIKIQKDYDTFIQRKVEICTNIVYKTAKARRPKISIQEHKALGRPAKVKGQSAYRVSDPNADVGVPVDTGKLQASITKDPVKRVKDKYIGRVWTNWPYAKYMEFGTSVIQARPFMHPALNINKEAIKRELGRKFTI